MKYGVGERNVVVLGIGVLATVVEVVRLRVRKVSVEKRDGDEEEEESGDNGADVNAVTRSVGPPGSNTSQHFGSVWELTESSVIGSGQ
ncbi:hypothetical protein C1H46_043729 [Malus baccata]|uniref:Uncharacterized protein n=1 Tax=Malus baccata TaxID=106549 RepID=A0A540K9W9_MALBA|nr:hypothetical protein C1H46_043729 [Malus baccata]